MAGMMPDGGIGSTFVPYGQMTAAVRVYTFHHFAENSAVSGSIPQMIVGNIIMYHLVDDNIFQFFFGQIETAADFHPVRNDGTAQQGTPDLIFHFAEEGVGLDQRNLHRRQFAFEAQIIEPVESILYKTDGWQHFWSSF